MKKDNYECMDDDYGDDIIAGLGMLLEECDNICCEPNPDGESRVMAVYNMLKHLDSKGVKVSYKLHKPYNFMGSVNLTGDSITISECKQFRNAIMIANNFEASGRTDGLVDISLGFIGLTKTKEE